MPLRRLIFALGRAAAPDVSGSRPGTRQNRPALTRWMILLGSRLWQELNPSGQPTVLDRVEGLGPPASPGFPGEFFIQGACLHAPATHALRLSSATLTPAPMVELIETFFR
jgi:hypothetical protein